MRGYSQFLRRLPELRAGGEEPRDPDERRAELLPRLDDPELRVAVRPLLLLAGADRAVRGGLLRCTRDGEALRVEDRCGAARRGDWDVLERVEVLRWGAARLLLLDDGRAWLVRDPELRIGVARLPELVDGRARDAVPLRLDGCVARSCGAERVDRSARLVGAVLVETRGATRYSRTRSPVAVDWREVGVARRTLLLLVVGERCGATRRPLWLTAVAPRSAVRRVVTDVAARVVGVRRLTALDARTGRARVGDARRLAPLAKTPDGAKRRSR